MIDVTTAQIVNQESAKQIGEVDVLFDVAEEVGTKLVGKQQASPQPVAESKATEKKSTAEKKTAAPSKPSEKGKPRSRITVGYMFPGYLGNDSNPPLYDLTASFLNSYIYILTGINPDYTAPDLTNSGFDLNILVPIKIFYVSASLTFTSQTISTYSNYSNITIEGTNFTTFGINLGGGLVYSIIKNLQLYGGLNVGYLSLTTDEFWVKSPHEDLNVDGLSFGIDTGLDYFIGPVCLGLKYTLSYSLGLDGDADLVTLMGDDTSFGTSGLVLSAGYGF